LSSIGSGFGFAEEGGRTPPPKDPIAYLGTVDFIKMHPGLFDAIDTLKQDASAAIWGGYDPEGEVASKAKAMRHPERIHFIGQTTDPETALKQSSIFFYPLQPDHYGTAENALIEAMSLGLVPVVLANPAECAIIEHGVTGFIGRTIEECSEILDMLLASPDTLVRVGKAAAAHIAAHYTAERSAHAFADLWRDVMTAPKRQPQFGGIVGATPLDWFFASQYLPGEARASIADTGKLSKGTLSHFRSAFPHHPCWNTG
jgi:glycosyltransferase involved in cell wall biosynthesis